MKSTTTITLAPSDQLALNIQQELVKLPTQAVHNHFHRLGEQASATREMLKGIEIVAPLMCALELEHQKKLNHGSKNWTAWIKSNCEFSHKTYTKYNKVLKHARAGDIKSLAPDLVPDIPPSQMDAKQLQETCTLLANALAGYRGIRQLYLELSIIKTPQRETIMENRTDNKKDPSDPTDESDQPTTTAKEQLDIDLQDAIDGILPALKPLDTYFKLGHHQRLPQSHLRDLDDSLQSARDLLRPLIK